MENQLEIIKSNLPYGYEGIIAEKVGQRIFLVGNLSFKRIA